MYRLILAIGARCYRCHNRFLVIPFWRLGDPNGREVYRRMAG